MKEDVLTVLEVSKLLQCSETTVEEQARRRELPGLQPGRAWVFPREALLKVLNDRALREMTKPLTHCVPDPKPAARRVTPPSLPV